MATFRIEKDWSATGWDWSIGPANAIRTWFAIWWAYGVDCGFAIGKRSFWFDLAKAER